MQVHAQHAAVHALIAGFATADSHGPRYTGAHYMHTSNLPKGRCTWIRNLIKEKDLTHAVSMDADTWCRPQELLQAMPSVTGLVAMGICPVKQGDGRFNLRVRNPAGELAFVKDPAIFYGKEIAAGGFGVVVFNLAWWRDVWPEPVPEAVSYDTGEDIELCRSVANRGGKLICLPVPTAHASFEGLEHVAGR
jgi:hypothetical protein